MKALFALPIVALLFPAAKAADLHLTPSVCAVEENESGCNIPVSLDFSADDNERYCLSIEGKGLIRCFFGNRKGLEVYVSSTEDIRFQITESESGERVAFAVLKVARYQPKRTRRRYGWGLL